MKAKTKKTKTEVPFDPVLFAATVPGRKPTAKDLADVRERKEDAIEPQQYNTMEDFIKNSSTKSGAKTLSLCGFFMACGICRDSFSFVVRSAIAFCCIAELDSARRTTGMGLGILTTR